jgi:inositol transport system substrate-binding protein
MKKKLMSVILVLAVIAGMLAGCSSGKTTDKNDSTDVKQGDNSNNDTTDSGDKELTIAYCFQDLETEFWVASYDYAIKQFKDLKINVIEYNGNQDPNKQLEQVNDAIAQGVDAILCCPQDSDSAVTIAKAANDADVPIAFINREPSSSDGINFITAVADNKAIAYEAGKYLVAQAKARYEATGEKVVVGHMIGDLGDNNAVLRKEGFEQALAEEPDVFGDVVEIATEWDANTALANLKSALQSNPDISLIFCGSDFLYPQIQATLEPLGLWNKAGEDKHIILGAVDGDAGAGKLMDEGYVDATAVQDVYYETQACIDALVKAINDGDKQPSERIVDPGFALTQANLTERHDDMWGNVVGKSK